MPGNKSSGPRYAVDPQNITPLAPGDRGGRPGPRAYRGQGELWDLHDRYIAWRTGVGYAVNSVKGAHAALSPFLQHLEQQGIGRVADVSPDVMEGYAVTLRLPRNGLPPAARYVNTLLISLKEFFKWLGREGLILYDPAADLELPRLPMEIPHTILTEDEVARLLAAPDLSSPVGYRDRAMIELFFGTAIRSSELMKLKIDDLDHRHQMVTVRKGKGGKDNVVPAPDVAMAFCREYAEKIRPRFAQNLKKDDGTLFLSWTGSKMNPTKLVEVFKRVRVSAGLDKHVTAMTLRHTVATMLLDGGCDSRFIQEMLSHEKLETTQTYMKVTISGLSKIYAATHPMELKARRARRCQGQPSAKT